MRVTESWHGYKLNIALLSHRPSLAEVKIYFAGNAKNFEVFPVALIIPNLALDMELLSWWKYEL
jgi:hypothetical protein